MKTITLALSLAIALACGSASYAQTVSAEESLKATHDLLMTAVKTANLSMVATLVHPQALGFFQQSQRLAELKPGVAVVDLVTPIIADLSVFSVAQHDTVVRQIGDVGIVALSAVLKSSKKSDRYLRSTYVYTRSGDSWKLLSWHTSDMPLKK